MADGFVPRYALLHIALVPIDSMLGDLAKS